MRLRSVRPFEHGNARHRVVVIGGGFAGLATVRRLRQASVEVILIDRQNVHVFQPLAYQVATGILPLAEITTPLRGILRRQRNAHVVLGEVTNVDLARRQVLAKPSGVRHHTAIPYDTLVVAAGSHNSYFGHESWQQHAPELKSVSGVLEVRNRILRAFEAAEQESDPKKRDAWLTFVVVGGGPTGVEMAGQIAELARGTLRREFRSMDPATARVYLVEANPQPLDDFADGLARRATHALQRLGVTPRLQRAVVDISANSVAIQAPGGDIEHIPSRTVIWAAGVTASHLASALAAAAGMVPGRGGRVPVGPDLTLPGHPEVLVLGDMAEVHAANGNPHPLPGVAPVAIQHGRYAARLIRYRLRGRETPTFRYHDKGNLATIGRWRAVADIKGVHLSGLPAWLVWLGVHIYYLIGFQNRALVLLRWTITFLTQRRGARILLQPESPPTDGALVARDANVAKEIAA